MICFFSAVRSASESRARSWHGLDGIRVAIGTLVVAAVVEIGEHLCLGSGIVLQARFPKLPIHVQPQHGRILVQAEQVGDRADRRQAAPFREAELSSHPRPAQAVA